MDQSVNLWMPICGWNNLYVLTQICNPHPHLSDIRTQSDLPEALRRHLTQYTHE